jgi:hypothetical protein
MDVEAFVDQAAAMVGLPLAPEHRAGVAGYFALAARIAERVTTFELSPADESGNTFVPVSPTDTAEQGTGSPGHGGRA